MASQNGAGKERRRRRLSAQEKYQVWLEVVAREASQREVADRWGVDRSTVIKISHVAKQAALDGLARSAPGRPGKSPAEQELEAARAEIARLRETVTEALVPGLCG
ncbi:MAG: helix-turn-helix domain-containing protein [Actinomycetota bacterium]|nr:helix-turn-helix domain-containing protein [Actinomycetota bacterium]